MTPKSKAKKLIELFEFNCRECDNSKISALILVNEMLNDHLSNKISDYGRRRYYFWQQVKQELEKL